MADIRINALATTAASTASDDFVAVDGSANGTRKLNAYSPTFGGNITVSGTVNTFGTANGGTYITTPGTSASTGSLFIQGGNASGSTAGGGVVLYGGSHASAPGWVRVGLAGTSKFAVNTSGLGAGTDVFTVDQAGNVTVSGTAATLNSTADGVGFRGTSGGDNRFSLIRYDTLSAGSVLLSAFGEVDLMYGATTTATSGTVGARLTTLGNFIIGSTGADGGQKLQVSGTASITGGTTVGGTLTLTGAGTSELKTTDASGLYLTAATSGGMYIQSNNTMTFRKASDYTTMMTLDTSGNATFAGDVTVSGGNMGVGIAASASIALAVTPSTLTGNTQYGVAGYPVFSSAATAAGYSGYFETKTAASAFTMAVGRSIFVEVPTIGAGSAITTQSGIYVSNQGAGSITNAYGIDIAAQSGATTTNIGLRNLGATVLATPAAAVTLATNSTMTFELTSNTSLTIKVRGTDGTTRSVALTLA